MSFTVLLKSEPGGPLCFQAGVVECMATKARVEAAVLAIKDVKEVDNRNRVVQMNRSA